MIQSLCFSDAHSFWLQETVSASAFGLPTVLDVLLPKIVNCCFKDDWQSRMGGMVAVGILIKSLPQSYLLHITPSLLHALLNVLKNLPAHSIAHRETIRECLKQLVLQSLGLDGIEVSKKS